MQCVFLTGEKKCLGYGVHGVYGPSVNELKDLCQSEQFPNCPRYNSLIILITRGIKK